MASFIELIDRIQTEADAYEYLEEMRWGTDGPPACPHCGGMDKPPVFLQPKNPEGRKTRTGSVSARRVWKCKTKGCRKQFSVLTNTPMHGTKISVRTWVLVTFEMCSAKNGVSAREIERKYNLSPKSAWFLLMRIREGMSEDKPMWDDTTVVVDETFIGGKVSKMNNKRRTAFMAKHANKRGNVGVQGKTPVVTLINRETGEVYSKIVNDVTRKTLRRTINEVTRDLSRIDLHTDKGHAYKQIGEDARSHEAADHKKGIYVTPNGGGSNPVESFFAQLKRSIDGTHHHVSSVHLHRYLAEFGYRHNTRQMRDTDRIANYYANLFGKRLTYRPSQQRPALAG